MIVVGIIVAIILFSVIVLIHEFGHFKAARIFGVKVEEFGLGIPPRARKLFTDKKGTLFSLNWLPLGGFVRLKGEATNSFLIFNKEGVQLNNEEIERDIKLNVEFFDKSGEKISIDDIKKISKLIKSNYAEDNLNNKPAWQQGIIILAGVFMNFILAFIIFSILFFVGVKPIGINTKIETDLDLKLIPNLEQSLERGLLERKPGVLLYPVEGSIAEKAGIKQGDLLLGIKTTESEFSKFNDPSEIIEIVKKNSSKEISLNIIKKGIKSEEIIKITVGNDGKIGSYLSENIILNENFEYKFGILDSIKYGALETYNQSLLTFKALGILVRKLVSPKDDKERQEAINQVSGPVGLVDFISNSISAGIMFLIIITAIISINLGVFNLLPIPALDGGRFVFITINAIIKGLFGRKAINEKMEMITNLLFFAFLIFLSIIITYNDILKIIEK